MIRGTGVRAARRMHVEAFVAASREWQKTHVDRLWSEARRLATALVEGGAERVLLYGALAHGRASPSSDLDLVAISEAVRDEPFPGRWSDRLAALKPAGAGAPPRLHCGRMAGRSDAVLRARGGAPAGGGAG